MQYNNGNSNNNKQIMSNNSNSNNIIDNSIKDNFRTPLTPLHRGGRERLHKLRLEELYNGIANRIYKVGNLKRAFSLIELSIVLIIIGLLVAGVTGGKSLIESAKTRALMNEIRGYKQAVNTFYVANDRFPGDANKDGIINEDDEKFYNFPAPYNNIKDNFEHWHSAPWIEMYLDKIIDFKVDPNANFEQVRGAEGRGYAAPLSKVYKEYFYDLANRGDYDVFESDRSEKYRNKDTLSLSAAISDYELLKHKKILYQMDQKMDDGRALNGNILSICHDGDNGVDDYLEAHVCYGSRIFFDFQ